MYQGLSLCLLEGAGGGKGGWEGTSNSLIVIKKNCAFLSPLKWQLQCSPRITRMLDKITHYVPFFRYFYELCVQKFETGIRTSGL